MRIALLHSFYSSEQSSGENVVVEAQFQALSEAGHDVLLLGRHTDQESQRPGYKLRAAWNTIRNSGADPSERLAAFSPDVVHIHNTVPNIGTAWVEQWPGPIVHTLHNFRPLCANGLLFRDGHVCTLCPDGQPWSAVEHACYRSSAVASIPIATRNAAGIGANPLLLRADLLIVLSEFAEQTYHRYGLPASHLRLVPNGVAAASPEVAEAPSEQRWIAVGRLRDEKGFAELLRGWPDGVRLDIVGDGPQRAELQTLAGADVRFLGEVPAAELRSTLPSYTGLVFTGLAPESATPLVILEAYEAGIPTLVLDSNPQVPALLAAGVAWGIHRAGTSIDTFSLLDGMAWAQRGGRSLRERCREYFTDHYTVDAWVAALEGVYREAIAFRTLKGLGS